jgi:hypothetical protein
VIEGLLVAMVLLNEHGLAIRQHKIYLAHLKPIRENHTPQKHETLSTCNRKHGEPDRSESCDHAGKFRVQLRRLDHGLDGSHPDGIR